MGPIQMDNSVNTNTDNLDFSAKLAGKYLTFLVGNEEYGVEIIKVQEIIHLQKITDVPSSTDYIRGIINLRGKVIPVIELRKKFKIEPIEDSIRTAIVIVNVKSGDLSTTIGIIIDDVCEVLEVLPENIEKPPSFGSNIDTDFILALCNKNGKVKILLDIDRVLTEKELESLSKI